MAGERAKLQVTKEKGNLWHWRVIERNGKAAAIGPEGFTRRASALRAAENHVVSLGKYGKAMLNDLLDAPFDRTPGVAANKGTRAPIKAKKGKAVKVKKGKAVKAKVKAKVAGRKVVKVKAKAKAAKKDGAKPLKAKRNFGKDIPEPMARAKPKAAKPNGDAKAPKPKRERKAKAPKTEPTLEAYEPQPEPVHNVVPPGANSLGFDEVSV